MKKFLVTIMCIVTMIVCGCFSDGIPEIPGKIKTIDTTFSQMKIRYGYSLLEDSKDLAWKRLAQARACTGGYELQNVDELNFYLHAQGRHALIGTKDNEIMFYGYRNPILSARVKNYLPANAVDVKPKVIKLYDNPNTNVNLYVWEMENGYLTMYVYVLAPQYPYYEQYPDYIAYFKNKKYLPKDQK